MPPEDDSDRKFADGLSTLSTKLVLELLKTVGIPTILKLTERGFKLPKSFSYQTDRLMSHITAIGNQVMIQTNGHLLRLSLNGLKLKAYCSERQVTLYKGSFYINIPQARTQPGIFICSRLIGMVNNIIKYAAKGGILALLKQFIGKEALKQFSKYIPIHWTSFSCWSWICDYFKCWKDVFRLLLPSFKGYFRK